MPRRRRRAPPLTRMGAQLIGVEETLRALRELPAATQRTVVRAGLTAGAQVVYREELRAVPIGPTRPERPGGRLLRSLEIFRLRAGKTTTRVFVGASAEGFYGRFLEFGTRFMAARPWLRPAVQAAFTPTVEAFRAEVRQGIDATVDDVARRAGAG